MGFALWREADPEAFDFVDFEGILNKKERKGNNEKKAGKLRKQARK
jgi:hypothetical protein